MRDTLELRAKGDLGGRCSGRANLVMPRTTSVPSVVPTAMTPAPSGQSPVMSSALTVTLQARVNDGGSSRTVGQHQFQDVTTAIPTSRTPQTRNCQGIGGPCSPRRSRSAHPVGVSTKGHPSAPIVVQFDRDNGLNRAKDLHELHNRWRDQASRELASRERACRRPASASVEFYAL